MDMKIAHLGVSQLIAYSCGKKIWGNLYSDTLAPLHQQT
jgi:hypothetical protein